MPPVSPSLSVPVHANQLKAVDDVCATALGCTHADVIGQLLLLVVTGLLAVVVIAAVVRIRDARAAVTEERSRTATEQQAFARFAREVSRLDAMGPAIQLGPGPGATSTVSASIAPRHRGLEHVRDAYEATVLAMDHYKEEYDEPLAEHMRRELGDEVAMAVEQSQQLTPPLKRALVARAWEAAHDRERLITQLNHELEALETADEELTAVADTVDEAASRSLVGWTFTELTDEWHRLGELESRLSRLLSRRQKALQAGTNGRDPDRPSLNEYLYGPLETTYPILADATNLADCVKDVRRRVLLALTDRA